MEIIRISPRGFGANTYVLTKDGKNAVVIDPAHTRVAEELQKLGLQAEYVLLTHCHFDHVGGVELLQEKGAKVICSAAEKPLVGTGAALFEMAGMPPVEYVVNQTLEDNEEVILCGMMIKMLLTPGHTKGSCCYLVTENEGGRYLFTGDTLFYDSIGRTDFPTGNLEDMRKSLRRLAALEDMPVYPGHNDETTVARERQKNPFMLDA